MALSSSSGDEIKKVVTIVADDTKKSATTSTDKTKEDEKKKEPEASFEILSNPARVLRQQLKVIGLTDNSQYMPLKELSIGGIVMVRNLKPGEEELVEAVAAFGPKGDDEKEPEPPEPFEWLDD